MSRLLRPRGARLLAFAAVTVAASGAVLGVAPLASAAPATATVTSAPTTGGAFVPLSPSRVLDTRSGVGAARAKVGPGASVTTSLVGRAGLPALGGATAVVLNLTATNGTTGGFLTAYPSGTVLPSTSSVPFVAGVPNANLVTVPLGADGGVSITNSAGTTDVVADVVGYYAATEDTTYGGLQPLPPTRVYDSRKFKEVYSNGDFVDIFQDFDVDGVDRNSSITGWVLNVTSVGSTSDGYVTAWDGVGPKPATSSLNFRKGVTTANLVEVGAGTVTAGGLELPSFRLQTTLFGGTTGLVVDVVGVYTTPGTDTGQTDARFRPLSSPVRIVDTRSAQAPNLGPQQTRTFSASSVTTGSTVALAANLTSVNPTLSTYLTVGGGYAPTVSSLNITPGTTRSNGAVVALEAGAAASFRAFNLSGTTPLVVDVSGTFEDPSAGPTVSAQRRGATGAAWSGATAGHRVG